MLEKKFRIKSFDGYYDGEGYYKGILFSKEYDDENDALEDIKFMTTPMFGVTIEPFYENIII